MSDFDLTRTSTFSKRKASAFINDLVKRNIIVLRGNEDDYELEYSVNTTEYIMQWRPKPEVDNTSSSFFIDNIMLADGFIQVTNTETNEYVCYDYHSTHTLSQIHVYQIIDKRTVPEHITKNVPPETEIYSKIPKPKTNKDDDIDELEELINNQTKIIEQQSKQIASLLGKVENIENTLTAIINYGITRV